MKDLFVAAIAIVAAVAGLAVYLVKGTDYYCRRPPRSPRFSLPARRLMGLLERDCFELNRLGIPKSAGF